MIRAGILREPRGLKLLGWGDEGKWPKRGVVGGVLAPVAGLWGLKLRLGSRGSHIPGHLSVLCRSQSVPLQPRAAEEGLVVPG